MEASLAFAYLFLGDTRGAANALLRVVSEMPDSNDILSTNEYVSALCLCVCACYLRGDVKKLILDNENIRKLLEYGRGWREILLALTETNYALFFQLLAQKGEEFLYSYRLAPFWKILYSNIRQSCFVDYFRPFNVMSIQQMAEAFKIPFKDAEAVCISLIEHKRINGRLDMENGVVYSTNANSPLASSTVLPISTRIIEAAERYLINVQFSCLQSQALESEFIVQRSS
jgi:hypothetical protein